MKKHSVTNQKQRGGFTLLELLIVLAIIVVIAAMVVPNLIGQRDIAQVRTTQSAIANVQNALKMYNANRGAYPSGGSEMLNTLTQASEFQGRQQAPYLESPPVDAWNNPLNYEWPNTKGDQNNQFKPAIWSNGPDGRNDDGGGDDINNWTVQAANSGN